MFNLLVKVAAFLGALYTAINWLIKFIQLIKRLVVVMAELRDARFRHRNLAWARIRA